MRRNWVLLCAAMTVAAVLSSRSIQADPRGGKPSPATRPAAGTDTARPAAPTTQAAPATSQVDRSVIAEVGDTVAVEYTGKLADGTVFDSSKGREPFRLTLGSGKAVVGFDTNIRGMKLHETRTFTLPPEQAYGPHDERMVLVMMLNQFGEKARDLLVGQALLMTMRNGTQIRVRVLKIDKDSVTLDANHELAGKTLTFEVELVELKKKAG